MKEVDFHRYCPTCKHFVDHRRRKRDAMESEICDVCLGEPGRKNTRVPANHEEAKR